MPSEYICYNGTEADIDNSKIEYDIDLEVVFFINLNNFIINFLNRILFG